jgi:hypothetical protein
MNVRALAAVAVAFLVPASARAADAPPWLQQAARLAPAAVEQRAHAVVLLDDVEVIVSDDGQSTTTRRRYAVKVIDRDGAPAAALREVYTTDTGRVRVMRGWVVSDGRTQELGKAHIADVALVDNDVYNESRARVISGDRDVVPGAVFGAETEITERTVFTQFDWWLRDEWPVRTVKRTLTLPARWEARWLTLNHSALEPVRTSQSYVWTLTELPAVPEEPDGPPLSSVVPRLAVTYFDGRARSSTFENWTAVSRWLASLAEPRGVVTEDVAARAREIAGGASSVLERVRAVANYAQRVQYISIQTGIGRGGGYVPRAAADVLARNYGDCKDKANLTRTMLASLGIKAHLVTVYAGDPEYVRDVWPSPQQFNHAIVAIAVPADVVLPGVVEDPSMGRLLLFDPTDEYTPLGQLPLHLQGSLALIVHAEGGSLIRVPTPSAEANAMTREMQATLNADGVLVGEIRLASAGDPARQERFVRSSVPEAKYSELLEARVRRELPGARVTASTVDDRFAADNFIVTMRVSAPSFAQPLPGGVMIVRPPLLPGGATPIFPGGPRLGPVVLDERRDVDRFVLTLPAGMKIDELPASRAQESPFGAFAVQWTVANGQVVRTLELRLTRSTVRPEQYDALRAFLDSVRAAERASFVLSR